MTSRHLTLNDALADYARVRSGRYAPNTWRAHEIRLEKWRTWVIHETQPLVGLTDVADPNERYMERYFNRLRPPAYKPRTFNNYRQILCSFWTYCRKEGWVLVDPMRHVDPVTVPREVRLQLSPDEQLRMLVDAHPRDRVGLAIGMNTALRAGDVVALNIGSVNLGNDTLTAWIEKTDEELNLPITAELHVELERWFHHYAEVQGLDSWLDLPNEWTLVPPAHYYGFNPRRPDVGGQVKYKPTARYSNPEEIVHRALKRLGHPTHREGFHTLRRSMGRTIFDLASAEGVPNAIRIAQAQFGHKNQATTELYLGITHERTVRDDMLRGKSFLGRAVAKQNEGKAPVVELGGVTRDAEARNRTA